MEVVYIKMTHSLMYKKVNGCQQELQKNIYTFRTNVKVSEIHHETFKEMLLETMAVLMKTDTEVDDLQVTMDMASDTYTARFTSQQWIPNPTIQATINFIVWEKASNKEKGEFETPPKIDKTRYDIQPVVDDLQ